MSDPRRYVIVDLADYSMMMPAKRTNLPDAEHIHVTRHPDGTITAEDADDRLRKSIAAHRYIGSLEEWRPIYDKLPVQMRSIIMHVQGEHDDPIGCYEHCALCHAVRSPSRVDCPTGDDQ